MLLGDVLAVVEQPILRAVPLLHCASTRDNQRIFARSTNATARCRRSVAAAARRLELRHRSCTLSFVDSGGARRRALQRVVVAAASVRLHAAGVARRVPKEIRRLHRRRRQKGRDVARRVVRRLHRVVVKAAAWVMTAAAQTAAVRCRRRRRRRRRRHWRRRSWIVGVVRVRSRLRYALRDDSRDLLVRVAHIDNQIKLRRVFVCAKTSQPNKKNKTQANQ